MTRDTAALDTSPRTVLRTKRRYAEEGLDGVLHDHPQANRYRKLDDRGEAYLIALACSDAPEGHDHWTLRLLADQAVELGLVESLSYETVRLRLKKTSSSRGGSNSGASPNWDLRNSSGVGEGVYKSMIQNCVATGRSTVPITTAVDS